MADPRLLLATHNEGKIREMRSALHELKLELVTLSEVPSVEDAIESTISYEENALIKAHHYARAFNLTALADDSGLEVDALGGRPGVLSARYGGENLSDDERVRLLLSEMRGVQSRSARFVCAIAIAGQFGTAVVKDCCKGTINTTPVGANGFGYDPVFIPENYNQTFAEMATSMKTRISHRAKALLKAKEHLLSVLP